MKFIDLTNTKNILAITLIASFMFHTLAIMYNFNILEHVPLEIAVIEDQEIRIKLRLDTKEKKRQIVETQIVKNKLPPKETRFLGKVDQSFNKQAITKKIGSFKLAGVGNKTGLDLNKKILKSKTKMNLKDLSILQPPSVLKKKAKQAKLVLGIEAGKLGQLGLARSNDYVEDVPLGDVTSLNTIEYKYFGFYNRIKQKLEQFWGRSLKEKADAIYRSGRRMPASADRITSVVVTIDAKGNIIDVTIASTSGMRELDEAAVESFNKAGPFPNPPKGMITNGVAKIEWGFVVKG